MDVVAVAMINAFVVVGILLKHVICFFSVLNIVFVAWIDDD
jgi:hypothetical protein